MPDYTLMAEQMRSLAESEPLWLPVLKNASALLNEALPDLNWVGFYLRDPGDGSLVLGPFQGKTACIRIAEGRGVCGTAAAKDEIQLVPDVQELMNVDGGGSSALSYWDSTEKRQVVRFHQEEPPRPCALNIGIYRQSLKGKEKLK